MLVKLMQDKGGYVRDSVLEVDDTLAQALMDAGEAIEVESPAVPAMSESSPTVLEAEDVEL